jgi:hypothetical protein
MSPKQALPANYTISIFIYDLWCALMCHEHLLFSLIPPFHYVTIHVLITWSISSCHPFTFLIIPTFHLIYAYHIPILSCYYLGSSLLLSYASIFHLIHTASYLFDYLCIFYILSYCSIFCSLPIGRSTPLIPWHCSSLSFLLSSEYSLHSYW